MQPKRTDIVLLQAEGNSGLRPDQYKALLWKLKPSKLGYVPVEIDARQVECAAMGFATAEVAEACDFDIPSSAIGDFVKRILDDVSLENNNGFYATQVNDIDVDIYIGYPTA